MIDWMPPRVWQGPLQLPYEPTEADRLRDHDEWLRLRELGD